MRLVLMHLLRRSHIIIFLHRLDPKRPTPHYKVTIFRNDTSESINLKFRSTMWFSITDMGIIRDHCVQGIFYFNMCY